jgi:hypothetical protein
MTDKMREEFEAAYTEMQIRAGINSVKRLFDTLEGSYISSTTKAAWWGWQASRAVIRVDLPHLFPLYREGVTEALLVHGIKVKQWGGK